MLGPSLSFSDGFLLKPSLAVEVWSPDCSELSNDDDSCVFERCDIDNALVDLPVDKCSTDFDNLLESDSSNGIVSSFESEPTTDLPDKDPMPELSILDPAGPGDKFEDEPAFTLSLSLAFSDGFSLGCSLDFCDAC